MPSRKDIKNILVIGSGPIVIGQASEFDYSGTQACKALKEEGYRVVLLNSNPASVMTDHDIADATYIEPMTLDVAEKIVEKEKIDAYLPTVGGQMALNFAMQFSKNGLDKKYNFQIIGAKPEVIEIAENRQKFREQLVKSDIDCPLGFCTSSYKVAIEQISQCSFPVILRSSFTLGGKGSGIAYNMEEFTNIFLSCLVSSETGEVSVEEYLRGWKEFEMEIVRDSHDNCIVVCAIENINPMGIHTGDSITVAPTMTLTDKEYQRMRNLAFKVMRVIGVDTGGANVQFALQPSTGRIVVIEMNPRVSRSSALASKATGFPIASVAAKIAVGMTLDEIQNNVINKTAAFEPTLDYVVTKIPRFDLEKFSDIPGTLGPSMKSVGEVMAIARSFPESIQKAIRSLGKGYLGLTSQINITQSNEKIRAEILKNLKSATPVQIFYIADAFRYDISLDEVQSITMWDRWFLTQIQKIVLAEINLHKYGINYLERNLSHYKSLGYADKQLAIVLDIDEDAVLQLRHKHSIYPIYSRVDSCAGEYSTSTNYLYSTYILNSNEFSFCESNIKKDKKVIIIGSGPNCIGQGIEFDYACVHAAMTAKASGYQSIIINCNPETVSTDHEVSNKLYLAPLFPEDVLDIIHNEKTSDSLLGVIVCYGGQTAINLADDISKFCNILGTNLQSIHIAEDRKLFYNLLDDLSIRHPKTYTLNSVHDIKNMHTILFPVIARPSYVIGGKSIIKINNIDTLTDYLVTNSSILDSLLIEEFVEDAIEIEIDAISDGSSTYVAGIIEHVERSGIHSGDSTSVLPYFSLDSSIIDQAVICANSIAVALSIIGLFNVQFLIKNDVLYVIEVNPRASRTVPFIIKSTSVPIVKIATKVLLGSKLKDFGLDNKRAEFKGYSVKKPVFSNAIIGSKIIYGPEMYSTGEEMIFEKELNDALNKAKIDKNGVIKSQ